ncbi:MAG: methyltransferase domain-containing protein [Desulfobacterales bacterium]|nr:methyltransferase domain-containing protein [Desulfobacterales bacterium]
MNYLIRFLYLARDISSRKMFEILKKYCSGNVLDVGGGNFYKTVIKKNIQFTKWVVLEHFSVSSNDERIIHVFADGCEMPFQDKSFDTVLNIQVLEHVFEPQKMVEEISRVLKPKGYAIFLIPQTSTIHFMPGHFSHYYNFTRFWIEESLRRAGLKQELILPIGGVWSSMLSHIIYFFFQSVGYTGMSHKECKRNIFFYFFYPLMIVFAFLCIPFVLIFSFGDLSEEPNNHLVVAQKD